MWSVLLDAGVSPAASGGVGAKRAWYVAAAVTCTVKRALPFPSVGALPAGVDPLKSETVLPARPFLAAERVAVRGIVWPDAAFRGPESGSLGVWGAAPATGVATRPITISAPMSAVRTAQPPLAS